MSEIPTIMLKHQMREMKLVSQLLLIGKNSKNRDFNTLGGSAVSVAQIVVDIGPGCDVKYAKLLR